jgi:carnitine-CoA ligase
MLDRAEGFVHLLLEKARTSGDESFGRFEGRRISFRELDRMSSAFALDMRRRGIRRGDRVAVMLRNSIPVLAVIFGLAKAGVVWVPVNVRQVGDGLRHILEHSDPALLVVDAELVGAISQSGAIPRSMLIHGGPRRADALEHVLSAPASAFGEILPGPFDCFAIMYTSGTTGRPKGVLVSHAMMRFSGEAARLVSRASDGDVLFLWEPLFHIGGAQLLVLPLISRATLALVSTFSASRFWTQVREQGATHIHYLGGILQILLKQPQSPCDRAHAVRIAWGGGCPHAIWAAFAERFGVEIRECYGMTETSSIATYNDGGPIGAVGRAVPWFDVEVLDSTGQRTAEGETGALLVRARTRGALFEGYFRETSLEGALRDGFFVTGDLASRDLAGNLYYQGRAVDSLRCKGENVSAWEVEHVAADHQAIENCAIIGVPAEDGDQDIKLFVKVKPGMEIDCATLSAWLGARLASYQNPRYIAVVVDFERTPSERILKHKLPRSTEDCWDRLSEELP